MELSSSAPLWVKPAERETSSQPNFVRRFAKVVLMLIAAALVLAPWANGSSTGCPPERFCDDEVAILRNKVAMLQSEVKALNGRLQQCQEEHTSVANDSDEIGGFAPAILPFALGIIAYAVATLRVRIPSGDRSHCVDGRESVRSRTGKASKQAPVKRCHSGKWETAPVVAESPEPSEVEPPARQELGGLADKAPHAIREPPAQQAGGHRRCAEPVASERADASSKVACMQPGQANQLSGGHERKAEVVESIATEASAEQCVGSHALSVQSEAKVNTDTPNQGSDEPLVGFNELCMRKGRKTVGPQPGCLPVEGTQGVGAAEKCGTDDRVGGDCEQVPAHTTGASLLAPPPGLPPPPPAELSAMGMEPPPGLPMPGTTERSCLEALPLLLAPETDFLCMDAASVDEPPAPIGREGANDDTATIAPPPAQDAVMMPVEVAQVVAEPAEPIEEVPAEAPDSEESANTNGQASEDGEEQEEQEEHEEQEEQEEQEADEVADEIADESQKPMSSEPQQGTGDITGKQKPATVEMRPQRHRAPAPRKTLLVASPTPQEAHRAAPATTRPVASKKETGAAGAAAKRIRQARKLAKEADRAGKNIAGDAASRRTCLWRLGSLSLVAVVGVARWASQGGIDVFGSTSNPQAPLSMCGASQPTNGCASHPPAHLHMILDGAADLPQPRGGKPRIVLRAPCLLSPFERVARKFRPSADWYYQKDDGGVSLQIAHRGEAPVTMKSGIRDNTTIIEFLQANIMPQFGMVTSTSYEWYLFQDQGLVWLFANSEEEAFRTRPVMTELAQRLRGKYLLVWVNAQEESEWIKSEFGLTTFPMVAVQREPAGRHFFHAGPLSVPSIAQLIHDVEDGCLGYGEHQGTFHRQKDRVCDAPPEEATH